MFIRLFLLLVSVCVSECLSAQYANLKFQNFSTPEGLSSSTCVEIYQDREGFLWFGTIDGLNRYNGYDFEIFRPILNDPHSISNNRVNAIVEDGDGNLWVGTSNGLNVLDKNTEKFYRINLSQEYTSDFQIRDVINDLLYDPSDNTLWVGTKNGLSKLHLDPSRELTYDHLEFSHYLYDATDSTSIDNNDVVSIIKDRAGDVWIGTQGKYLNHYNSNTDNFHRILLETPDSFELDHLPKVFLVDNEGDFWIGNDLSRLIIWNKRTEDFKQISPVNRSIPVFHMYQDDNGLVWVATDGYGIYIIDKEKGLLQHLEHNPADPLSMPNNQPSKIIQDKDGIFWLATYNKGVNKLAINKLSFGHYFHVPESENTLSTPIAQSVLEDSQGRIWIGTDGGGLNLFNEERSSFRHFRHDPGDDQTISSDKILYLEESKNGSIWVCTWDGGLNRFYPQDGKVDRFKHDLDDSTSLGQNTVWCAVEDSKERLWLGTQTAGLNVYNPGNGKFTKYQHKSDDPSSIISDFVFSLFIDSRDRLFVGTSIGLEVVHLAKLSKFIPEKIEFKEINKDNLQGKRINYVTEDHLGNIWVGTDLGLHKMSPELDSIRTYSTLDGLPNNLVIGVKEDNNHDLWITTKSGISRLDPESGEFKNFNVHDGLQGMEFQSKSIDKTKDGRILAGGINGFNIFDPNKIDVVSQGVKPFITSLRLFNDKIKVGQTVDNRVLLKRSISKTEKLVLKHNEGYITFDFVALYYRNPERVQYAYRMDGLDKQFINIGSNRLASYSGLPSGEYTFEVKASLDGKWENAESSRVKLTVLPAPWRTWWAYLGYMFVVGLVTWGSFRIYVNKMNEDRKHELDQMKLRFFMNVSHEFRTPLTLILNPVDKIISAYSDTEIVKNSAYTIRRSARKLLNLVNQLLDFRKLDLGKAPLDPLKADLVKFTKDIFAFYEELASSRSIQFVFSCSVDSFYMWFDPDKLEKIIGNLLSNAIKFTNAGGKVELSLSRYEKKQIRDKLMGKSDKLEYIEIVVTDTGVGLKKDQLNAVFERFFHVDNTQTGTGIGLNFTKSLVEQHDGEITVESEYGKGSRFIVRLPVYSKKVDEAIKSNKEVRSAGKEFDLNSIRSLEYDLAITDDFTNDDEEISSVRQTVLIVEDNRELRIHLKNELGARYRIKDAANGKEGLDKALKFYPDIIISDVMMPEMDGFEMCHSLKSNMETSHIPIILLTARSLEEDRMEGYSMGADAYLPKPFNVSVLKVRINNLLESRRKLKEKFLKQTNILPSSEITTNTLDEQFLDKATKAILDNMSDSAFGLDQLLQTVGVSRSHFYRKIQSLTGQNPSNFIRTVRLKYAAELLKQNTSSIKEVAYRSGFNSTAYFSKTFRELFEVTPNEFIKNNLNK